MVTRLGTTLRFHLLVCLFIVLQMLFLPLLILVGAMALSAVGLLITQHYGQAFFVVVLALVFYEAGYWLLIGKWVD